MNFKRSKVRILGIDPGLEGAAAILDPDVPGAVEVFDLPTSGEGTKRSINETEFLRLLGKYDLDHAFIEHVVGRMGWGAGGAFRFGMAFGALRAIVAVRGIPFTLVTPQKWKKFYGLKGGQKDQMPSQAKEQSRQRAIQLFPQSSELFSRKKDHQRGEAALIALYGLQTSGGRAVA